MQPYFHIICVELILLTIYLSAGSNKIYIEYRDGEKIIQIDNCTDLSAYTENQQLQAIGNKDSCSRFYANRNCNGHALVLPQRSSYQEITGFLKFDGKKPSVGPCLNSCEFEERKYKNWGLSYSKQKFSVIQLFSQKSYNGSNVTLHIKHCTLIPNEFINATMSVLLHDDCIIIYSTETCDKSKFLIELLPGQPFHDDMSLWKLQSAKAVSHCSDVCYSGSLSFTPPKIGEVYLYEKINFGGRSLLLDLSSNECITLGFYWDTSISSIIVGNVTCVTFFQQNSCRGGRKDVNFSSTDLHDSILNVAASSVQICSKKNRILNSKSRITIDRTGSVNSFNKSTIRNETNNESSKSLVWTSAVICANIVAFLAGVCVCVGTVLFVLKKYHRYGPVFTKLSKKEIRDFLAGLEAEKNGESNTANHYNLSANVRAQNKPYNMEYEIKRSRIKFDSFVPLGMGEFGVVYRGTLSFDITDANTNKEKNVAIKTANPSSTVGLHSLLKEVKIMMYLGTHSNIAQLIGCCTDKLKNGEILIVLEYYSNGSMESFLRNHQTAFINQIKTTNQIFQNDKSKSSFSLSNSRYVNILPKYDIFLLHNWCIQIAKGMEFLCKANVLHSDLAARNILLDDVLEAKISDFGLSRQLSKCSEYKKSSKEPLPWRWMAPESLKFSEFSSKSDVWSYGIVCWEIFSLGEKPYPDKRWNNAFIQSLVDGYRLNMPTYAYTGIYDLMLLCWELKSERRPTCTEIVDKIEEIFKVFSVNSNVE